MNNNNDDKNYLKSTDTILWNVVDCTGMNLLNKWEKTIICCGF